MPLIRATFDMSTLYDAIEAEIREDSDHRMIARNQRVVYDTWRYVEVNTPFRSKGPGRAHAVRES